MPTDALKLPSDPAGFLDAVAQELILRAHDESLNPESPATVHLLAAARALVTAAKAVRKAEDAG